MKFNDDEHRLWRKAFVAQDGPAFGGLCSNCPAMAGETRGRASDSTSDRSAEPPAKRPTAMANVLSIGYVKQHEDAGSMRKCIERLLLADADVIHAAMPADGSLPAG